MLNKKEKCVMQYLFKSCKGKNSCLVSIIDVANGVYPKYDLNEVEIRDALDNLILEKYITVVDTIKKGTAYFCISLTNKGGGFEREIKNKKISIRLLIIRTVLLACLSFIIGLILKAIFGK